MMRRHQVAPGSEEKITHTKTDKKPIKWSKKKPSSCKWNRIIKREHWKRNKTCYTTNKDSPWLTRLTRTTLNSNSGTELLTSRSKMRILIDSKWGQILSTMPRCPSKIRIMKRRHGQIQQHLLDLRITSVNQCSNNE